MPSLTMFTERSRSSAHSFGANDFPSRDDEALRDVGRDLLLKAGIPETASPRCVPRYSAHDCAAVLRVLDGEGVWRLNSEASIRLVNTFREKVHPAKHVIPVASGTAGIHTVISYYVETRGPKVLVPSWTWYAVAATVLNAGGIPSFVDLERFSLRISELSDQHSDASCLVVSHLFGLAGIDRKIIEWLRHHRIPIIEDCAQAIQGSVEGMALGRVGDASVYSFNGSKHLPAGEGGMIATDDDRLAAHVAQFIMSVETPREVVVRRFNDGSGGWNYRLGSITASLAEALIHGLSARIADALAAHRTVQVTLQNRSWLRVLGQPYPDNFAPLGCPVLLCTTIPNRSLAESRAVLYFALRLAGIPASVWVPDAIPQTRRLRRFYENHKRTPDPTADFNAKIIADGHIVLATTGEATGRYGADGPLGAVLDAFEKLSRP